MDDPFVDALADIDRFSHVWLLVVCDRSRPWRPDVVPHGDVRERGLFATRAPSRPNMIGLSVVRLVGGSGAARRRHARSKRPRFITLFHAATKSRTNFPCAPSHP